MARGRRRMTRSPGRARTRKDWVYRDDVLDAAGLEIDAGGTYTPWGSFLLTPGAVNAQIHILYDSANYRGFASQTGGNAPVPMGSWGRAEGRRAVTHLVQGSFHLTPSIWALGSVYFFGARIIVCDQDNAGNAVLDALYTMYTPAISNAARPARWANGHENKWEMYHTEAFSDNSSVRNFRVFTRARARLAPQQCLALYTETAAGSSNLNVNLRLRTLVTDEA